MSKEKSITGKDFFGENEAESVRECGKESFFKKIFEKSGLFFAGLGISVILSIGGVMYFSNGQADSSQYTYDSAGQYAQSSGQYNAQYAVAGGSNADAAAGASSGCGGGGSASGGSGGCCGGGGAGGAGGSSSAASASPAELEKQALEQYKKETGTSDVTAKAENRGCHTQIDIYDKAGNIVRSYGYQGGPLYVIK